ncbi:uncharacterized protein Triagg1_968 [Trichoderma aggressivum f. europaeum]|uniref:Uncharacterized protein n=1 Tax=Trichoderma aggressivum f. europaeum TaxID=173218 RepID=A0AAE1IJE4_9HYPO|nr:hypothetical protein Triagg1_968 [Trichoderma aggressivum f. europaeum]
MYAGTEILEAFPGTRRFFGGVGSDPALSLASWRHVSLARAAVKGGSGFSSIHALDTSDFFQGSRGANEPPSKKDGQTDRISASRHVCSPDVCRPHTGLMSSFLNDLQSGLDWQRPDRRGWGFTSAPTPETPR